MSLPDGWHELGGDVLSNRAIVGWLRPRSGTEVVLTHDGQVEVTEAHGTPLLMASLPVELLAHVMATWANHQASRAP